MPDEDKTFSGSLVLDLRIWCRHVHTLYSLIFQRRGVWLYTTEYYLNVVNKYLILQVQIKHAAYFIYIETDENHGTQREHICWQTFFLLFKCSKQKELFVSPANNSLVDIF